MAIKTQTRAGRRKLPEKVMFILLDTDKGWRSYLGPQRAVVCRSTHDISKAIEQATIETLWISSGRDRTDDLLRAMSCTSSTSPDVHHRWGSLLTLQSPRPKTVPFLRSLFRNLVGETQAFKWLPSEQLGEVLAAGTAAGRDLFIGGVCDTEFGLLTLVRGNLERVTVPLSIFLPSGKSKPDFFRFQLDDYGHTIRFGEYEASADYILYEADAEFRKRLKTKRRAEERSFGACLRRLRIQRGVSQDGFPGISAKTIGRIERGEVEKPHGSTLKTISATLGVPPQDIDTY